MNPTLNDCLQKLKAELVLTEELVRKAGIAKNNWVTSCFEKYAPGIVALVNSGQTKVAVEFARVQGFDLLEGSCGATAFRRNGEILSVWKLRFK